MPEDDFLSSLPSSPRIFQEEPMAIGSPEFARLVHALLNEPEPVRNAWMEGIDADRIRNYFRRKEDPLQSAINVSRYQMGPTKNATQLLELSKFGAHDFNRTNLLGVYDPRNREIGINPRLNSNLDVLIDTLVHENSHSQGSLDNIGDRIPSEAEWAEGFITPERRAKLRAAALGKR